VTAKERALCNACGAALEWLGKLELRRDEAASVLGYWTCPSCGRTWIHHSERGWRETKVDLTAD